MMDADEKTGITAITGLDLGANIGVTISYSYIKRFYNNTSRSAKRKPQNPNNN